MFLINPLELLFQLSFMPYIFGVIAFYGVHLCLRKLILQKGI